MFRAILLFSIGLSISHAGPLTCNDLPDGMDPSALLNGANIKIGLYSGELSRVDDTTGLWSGYDIALLDKLSGIGNFTCVLALPACLTPVFFPRDQYVLRQRRVESMNIPSSCQSTQPPSCKDMPIVQMPLNNTTP